MRRKERDRSNAETAKGSAIPDGISEEGGNEAGINGEKAGMNIEEAAWNRRFRFYTYLNLGALVLYVFCSFLPIISRIGYYLMVSQILFLPMLLKAGAG